MAVCGSGLCFGGPCCERELHMEMLLPAASIAVGRQLLPAVFCAVSNHNCFSATDPVCHAAPALHALQASPPVSVGSTPPLAPAPIAAVAEGPAAHATPGAAATPGGTSLAEALLLRMERSISVAEESIDNLRVGCFGLWEEWVACVSRPFC